MARLRRPDRGKLLIPVPAFWYRLSRGRRIAALVALLALLGVAVYLLARGGPSEQERVKSAVLKAVEATEAEHPDDLLAQFSRQYRGYYGDDFDDLAERVRHDFELVSDIRISIKEWDIQLEGDRAAVNVEFTFRLVYGRLGPYSNVLMNRLPSTPPGQNDKARLVLLREEGEWKIEEIEVAIPAH